MKKFFFALIVVIIIAAIFSALAWKNALSPADAAGSEKVFSVSKGEGIKKVSQNLYSQNLIRSRFAFETYIRLKGWEENIIAGEHILSPKLDAKEIAATLIKGNTVDREQVIRIIEGWNINDIDKYLADKKIIAAEEFKTLADEPGNKFKSFDFLKDLSGQTLEGYLFPDTYRIYKNSTAEDIAGKMVLNFDMKLTPALRAEITRQKKTLPEIISMASLIEKEVRSPEDMKIVSGIFWNRIENGQALQSCATLAYILGVNKPQYSEADTKVPSPYNTYQNRGLPPGPIANPGLNAILAAIYPIVTDYNYFLTAEVDGKSKVIYSASYDEHVRNKAIYLK